MNWFVDRIEGEVAVVEVIERGGRFEVPLEALPNEVKEGVVLTVNIDEKATSDREKRIKEIMDRLKRNAEGG